VCVDGSIASLNTHRSSTLFLFVGKEKKKAGRETLRKKFGSWYECSRLRQVLRDELAVPRRPTRIKYLDIVLEIISTIAGKMAENMTEEQLSDYKLAFAHFDKDNDGNISMDELRQIVEELGHSAAESEWAAMMQEIDTDADGFVDFAEFLAMMARRLMLSDNEEEILEAFKVFDKDNNGELSAQELKAVLTTLGEKLTPEECDELIALADTDHNGVINYREFVRLLLTR